jgi:ADP-ribose pyrophosphatase YjhB (NUDIX family)/nicotinic acid mononucleotide adenylyltransferase
MIYRGTDGFAQTADAIVFAGQGELLSVLLIQRKFPPYQDDFAFPGGFLEKDEDPLDACIRELQEETGLILDSSLAIAQDIREKKGRDPRGLTRTFPFLFHLEHECSVSAADDAKKAQWVKLTDLESLAFDHGAILCEALSHFWPQMPSFESSFATISLPNVFSFKEGKCDVFYGGSFNPWHEGHSECIKQLEERGKSLTIIPDSNPLKPLREGECFWKQYKQIAFFFEKTAHNVFPGFLGLEKPNPTAYWISQLERRVRFVFGDDNLFLIEKWVDFSLFLNSLEELYIVPRNHSKSEIEKKVGELSNEFKQTKFTILHNHDYQHLSSTKLRNC